MPSKPFRLCAIFLFGICLVGIAMLYRNQYREADWVIQERWDWLFDCVPEAHDKLPQCRLRSI